MDHPVLHIFQVEVLAARPEVALVVPVALQVSVDCRHHCEAADVKLPVLIEQWLLNVLLNYVGPLLPIDGCVRDDVPYLGQVFADLNATATVRVLARLHDPDRFPQFVQVAVWTHLILEDLYKLQELFVARAFFDVVLERQHFEPVLADGIVVRLHVVVDRFFVAEVEIVLHMVVGQHTVT